jgi:transposase
MKFLADFFASGSDSDPDPGSESESEAESDDDSGSDAAQAHKAEAEPAPRKRQKRKSGSACYQEALHALAELKQKTEKGLSAQLAKAVTKTIEAVEVALDKLYDGLYVTRLGDPRDLHARLLLSQQRCEGLEQAEATLKAAAESAVRERDELLRLSENLRADVAAAEANYQTEKQKKMPLGPHTVRVAQTQVKELKEAVLELEKNADAARTEAALVAQTVNKLERDLNLARVRAVRHDTKEFWRKFPDPKLPYFGHGVATPQVAAAIHYVYRCGLQPNRIARAFQVSVRTVMTYGPKLKIPHMQVKLTNEQLAAKYPEAVQAIQKYFMANPEGTLSHLQSTGATGLPLTTLYRIAKTIMKSVAVIEVLDLSPKEKDNRVAFAKAVLAKINEEPEFLTRLWFSDEKNFVLTKRHAKRRIWVTHGAAFDARVKTVDTAARYQKSMMWLAISPAGGCSLPHWLPTGLGFNAAHYKRVLVNNFEAVLPADGRAILQQDNAPCHKAGHVMDFMKAQGRKFSVLDDWPPKSPDLNPIENFWAWLDGTRKGINFKTHADLHAHIEAKLKTAEAKAIIINLCGQFQKRLEWIIEHKGEPYPA